MRSAHRCRRKASTERISYPGLFQFNAAEGWLELGNAAEALLELERLTAAQRLQPDVRFLRWRIFASCHQWRRCLAIARNMAERTPNDPRAWSALARSWRESGKIQRAYSTAVAHAEDFPYWWPLLYDAACYACSLGKQQQAQHYLQRALANGPKKLIQRCARIEPDLNGLIRRRQRASRD